MEGREAAPQSEEEEERAGSEPVHSDPRMQKCSTFPTAQRPDRLQEPPRRPS